VSFERAKAVADAVLFEGYVLYPYRASAPKNRARWQFGVVAPRDWSLATGSDPWTLETTCLVELDGATQLEGKLRFLQLRRRRVERRDPSHRDGFRAVDSLEVDGRLHVSWDEAEVREIDLDARLPAPETAIEFALAPDLEIEVLADQSGAVIGRMVRQSWPLGGVVRITAACLSAERPLYRLHVRVENTADWGAPGASRDEALGGALLGTHLLLAAAGGRFLSLTDPPDWAAPAARGCRNAGLYPVLVGEGAADAVVLAAPFILSDYPQIAPESRGDFFDATEIDELLTLRTMTLTDEEKRQVRATDPRAAALLDRVEQTSAETMASLHGAVRDPDPPSWATAGARVRLRPGARRTDAQDMFLVGKIATIEQVMRDVDGRHCFAVTVDDDPASDLFRVHGRYLYFYVDELERA
jgi:hypothetical protein